MIVDERYINQLLAEAKGVEPKRISEILAKADSFQGLTPFEVACLLNLEDETHLQRVFEIAGKIKKEIYGNRIVVFAPLYVSDHCVNNCKYCGYNCSNQFNRRTLSMEEVRRETEILLEMGHKRIALEAGEHPQKCPLDYILECLKEIYATKTPMGDIRRVNVNIAALSTEDFRRLKGAGIGTYILFQETYHKPTYQQMHISGPKADYEFHLNAFDRAMEAGIDDVGAGVLFGLYDYKFEVMALMLHNQHLEQTHGVGFHTISLPRLRPAAGAVLADYPHTLSDSQLKIVAAILRIAVPFTGMIISTRESEDMRRELLTLGISQISGGSAVAVGGYQQRQEQGSRQFEVADNRDAREVIFWLMKQGYIPSFCTACYRKGRTGDRFMRLAKTGNIKNVCLPNGLLTLYEYALDFGDKQFMELTMQLLDENIPKIENQKIREFVKNGLEQMKNGKRDLFV